MKRSCANIDRNDLEAAKELYIQNGGLTMEEWRMLHDLQDDPDAFVTLSEHWKILVDEDLPGQL
jgi:hypothetical protein